MTPALEALARRAVACRGWRWMPGMLCADGTRLCRYDGRQRWTAVKGGIKVYVWAGIPDLTDPATLGCLLALVREAWGDPLAYTMAYCGRWTLCSDRDEEIDPGDGPTEAEALIAALEAAP